VAGQRRRQPRLRFIQQFNKAPLLAVEQHTEPPGCFFIGNDSADLHFRPEGLPAGWLRALRWAHFGCLGLVRQPLAARLLALAEGLKAEGKCVSYDPNFRQLMDSRYDDTLERMCRLANVIKVSDEDLRGLFRCPDHHLGLGRISGWNPCAGPFRPARQPARRQGPARRQAPWWRPWRRR